MNLVTELKRRNVFRVAVAYLAAAWLLIQVAETLFAIYGLPDAAIQAIVSILAIAFVPVLILVWVFELTLAGLKLDSEAHRDPEHTKRAHRRLDRIIMVILAVAISYFAFDKFVLDPAEDARIAKEAARDARSEALVGSFGDRSVAVLAFDDMSPDGDQEYFSDGIAEELLNLLARIPELRVAGRTSAFSFKGKDATIGEIGQALNVAHVLEGSVRKSGNRIRITAQLIDAATDTHLWSNTYDRDLGDVFEIQDDIAARVVDELRVTLLGTAPAVDETDPESYALYLQARHVLASGNSEDAEFAEQLLTEVLNRDPDYVPALVALATAYNSLSGHEEWNKYSWDEGYALNRRALEDALRLDPDNAIANMHRGWQLAFWEGDTADGLAMLQKALDLEPGNSEIVRAAGVLLRNLGRLEQAVELFRRSVELDPVCIPCMYNLAHSLLVSRQYDEAEKWMRRRHELGYDGGYMSLGELLLAKGQPEAALQAIDRQREPEPYWLAARAPVLQTLGRQEEAAENIAKLEREWGHVAALEIAQVRYKIGDIDAAFAWLARLDFDNPPIKTRFHFAMYKPSFDALRDDPRWSAVLKAAGASPDELAELTFDIPPMP